MFIFENAVCFLSITILSASVDYKIIRSSFAITILLYHILLTWYSILNPEQFIVNYAYERCDKANQIFALFAAYLICGMISLFQHQTQNNESQSPVFPVWFINDLFLFLNHTLHKITNLDIVGQCLKEKKRLFTFISSPYKVKYMH